MNTDQKNNFSRAMEEDNPFDFGDDLVDPSDVKIKPEKKCEEPTIEEWVCRQNQKTLINWINKNTQEKIQKYLLYDWNNPSERVYQHMKSILTPQGYADPISSICQKGDPSDGALLRVLLKFKATFDPPAMSKQLTAEQLRMFLTHPSVVDPFAPNPQGANYHYHHHESPIELAIRKNALNYFKEMLQHSKDPQMDQVLKLACKYSVDILRYLIEDRGMSVNDRVGSKLPLQRAFTSWSKKKPCVDYLLSRGADVNGKDTHGNPVIFYAAVYDYCDIDKLINAELDIKATTRNMKGGEPIQDGITAFGIAASSQETNVLQKLFEYKAKMPVDSKFDRQVIADVLSAEKYTGVVTMWPFVSKQDFVASMLTERVYKIEDKQDTMTPIEKFFRSCEDLQKQIDIKDNQWDFYRLESNMRAIWRHLVKNLSSEEVRMLLDAPIKSGGRLMQLVASCNLLPEDYRLSSQLWKNTTEYDLGMLSNLPQEIVKLTLGYLSFNDACQVASVSKNWFRVITARTLWQGHPQAVPNCSNPFRSIQKSHIVGRLKKRPQFWQVVRLDDGEGLLVLENGFLTGLKLNGEPIMSTWPQFCGSVYRCIARCQSLSRDSIEGAVKKIEDTLNSGIIEFDGLVDTLLPFMKCLSSGFYDVEVRSRGDYKLFEYSSTTDFANLETEFPFYPLVYFTQPSDLLSEERVEYYTERIRSGCRPAALAISSNVELFIIDGHHKITAYKNLGLLNELVVVSIGINEVDLSHTIPLKEEMKYINHARNIENRYNQAKNSMRISDEDW